MVSEKTKKQIQDAAYYAKNREKARASRRAYYLAHQETRKAVQRAYYASNREKGIAAAQANYRIHREERRLAMRTYRANHQEKLRVLSRVYRRRRRAEDPEFKILCNLRTRVYNALTTGSKSARTCTLVGCTIPEFRAHLEKQFRPGMTWKNYGPVWHIDHIKPCAKFDLLDPAQQRECFHYTNQQPLFAEENFRKGAR